ncbi:MAG: HDOD domain-containing protein [Gammaproteobacteria bacterium]|nr:HDOD domain-containing protein [Gammaproteobacteria bacterium]
MKAKDLVSDSLQLVTLPDVYLRVKGVLDDSDSSAADMARAIETDPGMTARLLRMANSPFFGFAANVDTTARAVSLLGTIQIHDLLLATSVATMFSGVRNNVLNVADFWADSVRRGVASKLLATHCNVLDGERIFLSGLLSHIGKMIIAILAPGFLQEAADAARKQGRELHVVQREMFGLDYAEVGAELLKAWSLPAALEQTIRHQNDPSSAKDFATETAIVHIAARIPRVADESEAPPIRPAAYALSTLTEEAVSDVRAHLDAQVAEVIALLFPVRKSA